MEQFSNIFTEILNKQASKKSKDIPANHSNFINKTLKNSLMKRSLLRNKFLNNKSKLANKSQGNCCANLLKKTKMRFLQV